MTPSCYRAFVLENATVPLVKSPSLVVDNLVVEVLEGPDTGLRAETEDEHLTVGTAPGNFLRLSDPTVSGFHLELSRTPAGIRVRDIGSTNGILVQSPGLGSLRLGEGWVPPGTSLKLGNSVLRLTHGTGSAVEILEQDHLGDLLGSTDVMRRLMARVYRLAQTQVAVLITGESGTGKELVARAIHENSARSKGPFVTVDCGALSPNLVASELFGHEKGAFTNADRQHIGAFERADGGTVFLDEIGELPAELQPQLLGALERQRFQRVGGRSEVKVDVRIVSATNRDLRSEVNHGAFRMDLYYRIAVVALSLPPLRERTPDLPLLIGHFLKLAGFEGAVGEVLSQQTLGQLEKYRWPGNVRELRNWVDATLAMGEAPELGELGRPAGEGGSNAALLELPYKDARMALLDDFERHYCDRLLQRCDGNVSKAARVARMDRSYLIKLVQRHGLK